MYPTPWTSIPHFIAHDWTKVPRLASLQELAELMCTRCAINDGDSIVGSSLGGMVACEIARLRHVRAVFLIGSALHPTEVSRPLRLFSPLINFAPLRLLQRIARHIPAPLSQMYAASDPQFLRCMTKAVFSWRGALDCGTRLVRIHGRHDPIIPRAQRVDLWVDGGHLLSMSHPEECMRYVSANH